MTSHSGSETPPEVETFFFLISRIYSPLAHLFLTVGKDRFIP